MSIRFLPRKTLKVEIFGGGGEVGRGGIFYLLRVLLPVRVHVNVPRFGVYVCVGGGGRGNILPVLCPSSC